MSRPRDGTHVLVWICMGVALLIAASAVVYFGSVLILGILRGRP